MPLHRLIGSLFVSLLLLSGCSSDPRVQVTVHTGQGDIVVAVDTVAAPNTSANFLQYVRAGLYDGGSFFRVVRDDNQPTDSIRIDVIQGRANLDFSDRFFDPIDMERTATTGILHTDGTISMARGLNNPHTATHSFFFTIGDQPSLDYGGMRNPDGQGFAAFGKVLEGMEVIRSIQSGDVEVQMLVEPVLIDSVRVN